MKTKILNKELAVVSGGVLRKEKDGSIVSWGMVGDGKKIKRTFKKDYTGQAVLWDWTNFNTCYKSLGIKDLQSYGKMYYDF